MSTKTNSTPVACFTIGAQEIALADTWRGAKEKQGVALKALALRITGKPDDADENKRGHGVSLSALLPKPAGEKRTNFEQAAFDFTKRVYWLAMFGADIAALINDANVKGDTVLPMSSVMSASGNPYKDQIKRQITQSFGTKYFYRFVAELQESLTPDAVATKKREQGAPATDALFVAKRINDIAKRLQRDAEKMDGTVSVASAPKLAAMLLDVCKKYGVDVDKLVKE